MYAAQKVIDILILKYFDIQSFQNDIQHLAQVLQQLLFD